MNFLALVPVDEDFSLVDAGVEGTVAQLNVVILAEFLGMV